MTRQLPACGGPATARLHMNESALGTPPKVIERIAEHLDSLHEYPVELHARAVGAVADHFGVAPAQVLITNGVDEATDVVLLEARAGLSFTPGFDGYWDRAAALGVSMRVIALGDDWEPPAGLKDDARGRAVLVAQPNNPTGNIFDDREWLIEVLRAAAIVLLDETYIDFADAPSEVPALAKHGNLCVFRSFSKAFGLAGLRLGALLGPPELVARLGARTRFLGSGALNLAAVLGALEDPASHHAAVAEVLALRSLYAEALGADPSLFERVVEGEGNFVIAQVAAPHDAPRLVELGRRRGLLVSHCARLGLPNWIRVTVGAPKHLELLRRTYALSDRISHPPQPVG